MSFSKNLGDPITIEKGVIYKTVEGTRIAFQYGNDEIIVHGIVNRLPFENTDREIKGQRIIPDSSYASEVIKSFEDDPDPKKVVFL